MSPRGFGRVYARPHGPAPLPGQPDERPVTWWIEHWVDGVQYRERCRVPGRKAAADLLKRRLAEVQAGTFDPQADRIAFNDLVSGLESDYLLHDRKTLKRAQQCIVHLRGAFGHLRAKGITSKAVKAYMAHRLEVGASRASLRMETSLLARMLRIAGLHPRFERLKIDNTRTASFTDEELDAVLDVFRNGRPVCPTGPAVKPAPYLVAPIVFAAWTGWRVPSDVLTLRWSQVDLAAGEVTRWSRGTSKAEHHVVYPFGAIPELAGLLAEQRERTTALEKATGRIVSHVFHHRGGQPIRDLYAAWRTACRIAGVPGRRPHDLRRTAARRLRALGMSDRDIAELVGWGTVAMVERYLGKDPKGVAARLRARLVDSGRSSRTWPAHGGLKASEA
jgi:integrase